MMLQRVRACLCCWSACGFFFFFFGGATRSAACAQQGCPAFATGALNGVLVCARRRGGGRGCGAAEVHRRLLASPALDIQNLCEWS